MPAYKTIVIDPPWNLKTATNPETTLGTKYGDIPYDTMSLEELREFPINDFADDDSIIFLWVANGRTVDDTPIIQAGFELLQVWGFRYNAPIVWHKSNTTCMWSPIQLCTEIILFGWRKQPLDLICKMKSIFEAPSQGHSVKPARFYQLLRAWTPAPRIDIFARNAHEGFDGWGNEYVGEGPLKEFL